MIQLLSKAFFACKKRFAKNLKHSFSRNVRKALTDQIPDRSHIGITSVLRRYYIGADVGFGPG